MRLRPANISLINRRLYLLRLLLTLSSIERRPAHLDRSLHISSVLAVARPESETGRVLSAKAVYINPANRLA